jgi:hypothetical protein
VPDGFRDIRDFAQSGDYYQDLDWPVYRNDERGEVQGVSTDTNLDPTVVDHFCELFDDIAAHELD